ncbi:MAG TPA: DUF4352 domain-containing protein [Candidatus Elarobacter sp.]|nr:DUF4352 domain-containing protein [Candidatus Elarobacter sp.]
MYCTRCGAANAPDAQFCSSCGNALATTGAAPPPGPAQPPSGAPPSGGAVLPPYASAPKKPSSMAARVGCIGCGGIIALLLLFAIIGAMTSKGGNAPAKRAAVDQSTTASTLGGKHLTIHFKNGKKLDGVFVDETEYGIYTARVTSTIGGTEFTEPTRAGGRFVILELVVRNDSKEAREISLSQSKLIDAQGNAYSTSSEGETALTMSGDHEAEFLLSQLQPGLEKYLKIVFDVPAGKKAFTLRIPHGMFSGGEDGELAVRL